MGSINRKILLLIIYTFVSANLFAQAQSFRLRYHLVGLGSNQYSSFPVIVIDSTQLQVKLSRVVKNKAKLSGVIKCKVKMRQTSIDSIASLVDRISDTSIVLRNPCILSGGLHRMAIVHNTNRISYRLENTFDRTALKIAFILNEYLPDDCRIYADEKYISDAEECIRKYYKDDDPSLIMLSFSWVEDALGLDL